MAKAITSIGTYSNTLKVIRQSLSRMMDDCITGPTGATGSTTTITFTTMEPPDFYNKPNDYFNEHHYELYINAGSNIGNSYVCTDWVNTSHVLTFTPTASTGMSSTTVPELHRIFYNAELLNAINRAIDFYSSKYLIELKDETTIHLTRTERNDVSDSYIPTYEYSLPTDCLWLHRVTTEDSVSGVKITGTLSDDFTLGETVNGSSSSASGLISYTDATTGYIRIREESGTFTTSDTITGATSEETVTSITEIDRTEQAGDGKFPPENLIDPRDWRVIKAYAPKLVLAEGYYTIVEDLRLRLEYQGIQDVVTSDTDTIMLPPHEFVEVAATFLPYSKIESNNLTAKFNQCIKTREKIEKMAPMHPYANARKCW